ncbi:unnamed protein product [Trichobilharzia szidati]|nr:unnamed protein product [Trichobilharzia szidati]
MEEIVYLLDEKRLVNSCLTPFSSHKIRAKYGITEFLYLDVRAYSFLKLLLVLPEEMQGES